MKKLKNFAGLNASLESSFANWYAMAAAAVTRASDPKEVVDETAVAHPETLRGRRSPVTQPCQIERLAVLGHEHVRHAGRAALHG